MPILRKLILSLYIFSLTAISCQPKATLLIINAKVWTVDEDNFLAQEVAILGDKILAVGWQNELNRYVDQYTEIIDTEGKLVLPGFNDAHLHFISGGLSLMRVNLLGCRSVDEIQQRIKAKVDELPSDAWIIGRGWDHTLFNAGEWPTKEMLDEVAPNNPVFVKRVDGHVAWANSKALTIAEVTAVTIAPAGGEIVKDVSTGEPTGILKESAMQLVSRYVPEPTREERLLAAEKALAEARRLGVTSIQDNSGVESVTIYRLLQRKGKLNVRVSEWMDFALAEDAVKLVSVTEKYRKYCDGKFIRLGLLKGFTDGTLGSRTAYFFDPYTDDPTTSGMPQISEHKLTQMICTADSLGFQVGLHAIGSKANWMALNGYAESRRRNGERDSRHRLEHAQVLRLEDIPRLSELGVIASMQPTHCTSDMRWAEERIGQERCKGAYAWRRILDSGAKICFGTDWPVEPLDPMRGIYSAVTRQSIESGEPEGGWFPEQKLTMAEAIKLYTLDAAYAEFQKHVKGSIKPGKYADLIILSKDLFSIPSEEILSTEIEMTIVGGKIVHIKE